MDAPVNNPTPPPANAGVVNASPDDPLQSPDRLPGAVFARRRNMKAGGVDSPVRRSPRLSCLPPPQPPTELHVTEDLAESSDDESESVHDVALHLSRDETPENDDLPPDEPSSVLADRIMRAHDNPSPPPQDLAHPGTNYLPGKDGQFPLSGVSVPPSPFRSINLLERLSQFQNPLFDLPRTPKTPPLDVEAGTPEPGIVSTRGFISLESFSPSTISLPMKSTICDDLASTNKVPSPSAQRTVGVDHSLEPVVDPPSNPVVSSASNDRPRESLSRSDPRRHSAGGSLPLTPTVKTQPSSTSSETSGADTTVLNVRDNNREGLSFVEGVATGAKEDDPNSLHRPDSLSLHSSGVLARLRLAPEPTSPVKETALPRPIHIEDQPATPPRVPTPSIPHPDFSRTSVQRPIIAPTPVRANEPRKLTSPSKLSLETDDIYRTPAQRVPIESALARGNASLQKTVQLSTGQDQSRLGRFPAIRAPVFTRPALDDPSRSPAKRVPIADTAASPTRGHQTQYSPTRLTLRARSTSVEPCPQVTVLARSRSVEPCMTMTKPDNHGKTKETVFPMVPVLPRTGIKLPFPLVLSQKFNNDLPLPIPEEHENEETGNTGIDATLTKPTQSNTTSQLRQPPVSSRIPRIGNKPYARPPKNRKTAVGTTTGDAHASGVGNGIAKASSTQHASDQRMLGSLKRKRGADTTPPNPHPVIIRQVVPGILSEKYAPKPVKLPSQVQVPTGPSPPKAPQPLKFRKVVNGMLSARYAPAKTTLPPTEPPSSPLSDLSSLSDEGSLDENRPPTGGPSPCLQSNTSDNLTNAKTTVAEPSAHEPSRSRQDVDDVSRPRRTSRTRKPAQQQYVLDVFSGNASTRPAPTRRKPQPRTDGDSFMGMSVTALKALTTSNTTKNQQTVAILATEVIRKEGLRPESPMVKARTILQKQRDERDMRRIERAQRRAKISEESSGGREGETQNELDDRASLSTHEDQDENGCDVSQKHHRGPGDEEDYETPERPERVLEPLRFEGVNRKVKPVKQVKWHRGLSTAVYLDEVDPKPKSISKNVVVRGCLAPTSKNLSLDPLGNLVDLINRPFPELITEQIVVKRYLYDNDIEPEPIPPKVTRSRSKKSKT